MSSRACVFDVDDDERGGVTRPPPSLPSAITQAKNLLINILAILHHLYAGGWLVYFVICFRQMRPSYRDEKILHTACVCRFQKYSAFSLSILLYIIIININIFYDGFWLLTTHAHKHTWLNVINHLANSCYIGTVPHSHFW